MGPVEECLCDSGIDKRNVRVVALIAGSTRLSHRAEDVPRILQWGKHSAELVVLSSLHTETTVPMNWDGGTM